MGCQNPGDATASTGDTGTTQNTGDNSGGNASGSESSNNQAGNNEGQESGGDKASGDGENQGEKEDDGNQTDSIISVTPWGILTTKTVLSGYSDKTDAKIKFTYFGNEDVDYDCPFLYTGTDKNNIYGTKAELDGFKVNAITKGAESSVEYTVADLVTAMGDAEYLTYDAWAKIDKITAISVSYKK